MAARGLPGIYRYATAVTDSFRSRRKIRLPEPVQGPRGQERHLWKCQDSAWVPGCRPSETLWLWGGTLNFAATTPAGASKLRIEHAYRNPKTQIDRPGKSWVVHFPNTTTQQSVGGPQVPASNDRRSVFTVPPRVPPEESAREKLQERVAFLKLAGGLWVKARAKNDRARTDFAVQGPSSKWFPKCTVLGKTRPSRISWVGEFRQVFAEMFAMHLDRVLGL
jgi:hypothetical protein